MGTRENEEAGSTGALSTCGFTGAFHRRVGLCYTVQTLGLKYLLLFQNVRSGFIFTRKL